MKFKVIFDTNVVHSSESTGCFFGGRSELEHFAKIADIVIPDMVMDEIKAQKKRELISSRDKFVTNPFHALCELDKDVVKNFDIDKHILELLNIESIPHTVVELKNSNILWDIKKFSLEKKAPFEDKPNTDKGFKDVYIYFTILEYLETNPDERVFFVTNDGRLRLAFDNNSRIKVVKDYEEFQKYIDTYFKEEYFIESLKDALKIEVVKEDISEICLNTEGNWIVTLTSNGNVYRVEVDFSTREIISFIDFDLSLLIFDLINSGSFKMTHHGISSIKDYSKYFSDAEIESLIRAAVNNDEILMISTDQDVKDFFSSLFRLNSKVIPEDLKGLFESKLYLKQI